jgi:hypothetical protein
MGSIASSRPALAEPALEIRDTTWQWLYRVGGAAALASVAFIPIAIVIYVTNPPPSTVDAWFSLSQRNRLIGLLDLDLLMIVGYVLSVPTLLALYVALRRVSQSFTAIALALGLVAVAVYLSSNPSFSMLLLSDQYAAATSEAQRSLLLAAGQTMLTMWQGTAYDVGYVLAGVAGSLMAIVMLKSDSFSKTTAYLGIVANVLAFVPPTVGTIGMIFAFGSLVPLVVWDVLIARWLLQLARGSVGERLPLGRS